MEGIGQDDAECVRCGMRTMFSSCLYAHIAG